MSIIVEGVTFTDAATIKIQELLTQEDNKNLLFRVKVIGGGCSGLQYSFEFDENDEEDEEDECYDSEDDENEEWCDLLSDEDLFSESNNKSKTKKLVIKNKENIPIAIIDFESLQYLKGCTVDYVEDLTKSSFVINNPNAKAKCGCGNSFTY